MTDDTRPAGPAPGTPGPEAPSRELTAIVEGLIFASPEPLTPRVLFRLLADESRETVQAALEAVRADYEARPGLQLVEVAGGYQIVTRPELHEWVRRLFHERSTRKLTVQGLETLAVIAYQQPVTALEVGAVRGVDPSGVFSTLLDRHLVKIVGRKNVVGRPFLYGTTKEFLIRFGLNDIRDLPRIEDMVEALGFDPPAGLVEQNPDRGSAPARGRRQGGVSGVGSGARPTLPLRAGLEGADLGRREVSPLAGLEVTIAQRTEPGAGEASDRMTDGLAHPPDLPVPALPDRDAQESPRRVPAGGQGDDTRGTGALAVEDHTRAKAGECPAVRDAGHLCLVGALGAVPGVRQHRRQFAVVGQQQ